MWTGVGTAAQRPARHPPPRRAALERTKMPTISRAEGGRLHARVRRRQQGLRNSCSRHGDASCLSQVTLEERIPRFNFRGWNICVAAWVDMH